MKPYNELTRLGQLRCMRKLAEVALAEHEAWRNESGDSLLRYYEEGLNS